MAAASLFRILGRVILPVLASAVLPTALHAEPQPLPLTQTEEIVIVGVEAYNAEPLLRFGLAHAAQTDGEPSANAVAAAIEQIYREDGYPLVQVGVSFSQDGAAVFTVDEGLLTAISISGLRPQSEKAVRRHVEGLVGDQPIRQKNLERSLALASDLSGIRIANQVVPDPLGKGSILAIAGGESRSSGGAGVEVVPLRPGSAVRAFIVEEIYGVATGGDMLRLLGQATLDRGDDWSASGLAYYRTPVGSNGTYVEAVGGNTAARRDFAGVTGDSVFNGWNAALVVGHPVQRSLTHFTYLLAEYEFIDARSRFLAQRLQSTTHSIRLRALTGADLADHSMYRISLTLSAGRRPDTRVGALPDGAEGFVHVRAEAGVSLPLDKDQQTNLRVETRGQFASVRLPEVERIALGHAPFLRGYAPAEVIGDRGAAATIEVMHSVPTRSKLVTEFAPFAFAATGYIDVLEPRGGENSGRTVAAVGAGSNFMIRGGLRLSGWMAVPLLDGPQSRAGNPAFHLSLTVGW